MVFYYVEKFKKEHKLRKKLFDYLLLSLLYDLKFEDKYLRHAVRMDKYERKFYKRQHVFIQTWVQWCDIHPTL